MQTKRAARKALIHGLCFAPMVVLSLCGAHAETTPPIAATTISAPRLAPRWTTEDGMPPLTAPHGVTALSGRIVTTEGAALQKVQVRNGSSRALTDEQGRFLLTGVSPGTSVMIIDAREVGPNRNTDYGYYEVQVTAVAGETTTLPFKSWLPKIDHAHDVTIASPTTSEVVIKNPDIPGFEFHLPPGAVITGPDHKPVTKIGITPVPVTRTPYPLPTNVRVPMYFTVQPGGATITGDDGQWLGAQVWYPNVDHQLPGARGSFWRYDPYHLGWSIYGVGSVTADGQHVVPDPDTRVYDFTSAMFNPGFTPPASGPPPSPCPAEASCAPPQGPPPPPPCASAASCPPPPSSCVADGSCPPPPPTGCPDANPCGAGHPVDLASGFWVEAHVDLYLNDVLPIILTRTYRQGDPNVQDFGVGMTLNYELYLWSANLYQNADLITPAGGRVHYVRVSPGTGSTDAVYITSSAPGPYFNSKIFWNGNGWTLQRQDGMSYVFSPNAGIEYLQDRYGNRISFTRSGGVATPITTISSSDGRSINLTYTNGVITSATDNIGRTVSYTYDSSRRMQTVTDPDGGITTYTWDTANNRITAVQLPRQNPSGPAAVINSYDSNGRVQTQTLADSTTWHFAYTLDGSGKVIETDVTDPDSNVRKVTFNSSGYWLTDKRAFGSAVEQDFTAVRGGTTPPGACTGNTSANSPTSYLIAETDALGRLSCWTYDSAGSVLTMTKLAGTADQINTTLAYGAFEQITQITDPLSHTTTIGRDSLGRPTSITDALNHVWTISTNSDGTTASITDPLSHLTAFSYDHGDLVTTTDPLGRVTTEYSDAAGRRSRLTDPVANLWNVTFDPAWGRHQTTDPNANTTTINFNGDGLVSAVVDPRNTVGSPIQTQFTYDTKDRLTVRTDALSHTDTITSYDGNDNVLTATDRKGQNVTYTYDALNRISTATYADGHVVSYTWDAGNRLTQIQDTVSSVSNTITRAYDGLDRLKQEQVVQGGTTLGTVNYTYDTASRHATMSVSGQSQVTYTWDNADRLTQVAQGSAIVGFTYDNANRRATLTLPNGIIATYTYDVASQLTQLSYDNGTTNVGTLTYDYDNAGRITSRAGTLFQSVLPAAVATTGYNAGNQLTQWGSASPTYDLNGNLTSDGTNSYTWDARNRLTALTGIASFVYDGSGRRQSLTEGSTTLTSVYDRYDPVQEQSGGSVPANLLTGLGIDERFARTESSSTSTFLVDALGSTVALTDSSASVQTSYGYDPYGVTSTSGPTSDNFYQFTGRQSDGTGLYYYRARYYNPNWGRFISEDPAGFRGGSNLYRYVGNNPASRRDPLGLWTVQIGIGGNVNIGWWAGININGGAGIAFDASGFGGYYYGGLGAYGGSPGASGGVQISASNASTICDLRGPFINGSGTLAAGLGGSIDGFISPDGSVIGGGFTAGGGFEAGGAVTVTGTGVRPF